MAEYRAQVVLNMDSGVPADAATNTWYFGADTALGLDNAEAALQQFYADIQTLLSSLINPATSLIKWYDMGDPEPRVPIRLSSLTLTTGTGAMAPELALVGSYQAERLSGVNQARRRGRVFIGPLSTIAGDRPGAPQVADLRDAMSDLLLESSNGGVGTTEFLWLQHSQTDGTYNEVATGWVDNEFDTQRRRGRLATTRNTF